MRYSRFVAVALALFAVSSIAAEDSKLVVTSEVHNVPPDGFVALFNGQNLKGWRGLGHFDPRKLRAMSPADQKTMFAKNWEDVLQHWTVENGELVNDGHGAYMTTLEEYGDFELHASVKMTGTNANSGVCIRTKPTSFDNVPGYQVDMGGGYWGCLWDERRDAMVDRFDPEAARKLVKADDWNHFYIVAKGHHIQGWLNGFRAG